MSVHSHSIVAPQLFAFEQPFALQNGDTLPRFDLAVETYGTLNPAADNAVLICHALSGDHHVAGRHHPDDKYPGWWDNMVGAGKPIDTDKFFVVGLNNLGGCAGSTGTLSRNPATGTPYGADFPFVTVPDWVRTQALLADRLGIARWAAVVGGSLGGMQALQWTLAFPERVRHALVIAFLTAPERPKHRLQRRCPPSHHHRPRLPRRTLHPPPHPAPTRLTHRPHDGTHHLLGRTRTRTQIRYRQRKHPHYQYHYGSEFEVESYLRHQGDKFSARFDANTYLLMTKALDYFDPAAEHGHDLQKALAHVRADFFVASFSSDWRFAPSRSHELVRALIGARKNVRYIEVPSQHGHDAFLMEDAPYINAVRAYMHNITVSPAAPS
nr:homoserine O-acetyltransferase [Conchiformibius kuhniae]